MNEIPSRYNPKDTEDKWYKFWEDNSLFSANPNPDKKPFTIVIPPPNVTGILHMGHALNNTIQDILIRYHKMKTDESLWVPGTDHAGIATQNAVEKSIAKENLKRQDLGRDKFIERVWLWREQYGSTIIRQLKKLGASCDWKRLRFTMDEEYSKAVIEAFVRLYEKGLIYRGSYIINWCPRCQTALSDEEAPHHELQGNLYYIKYPLKESVVEKMQSIDYGLSTIDYIVVATTRPETMLGDTAVAVHPKDKRYKKLIGKILILPLVNREIKIIADSMVDMKFGTGAVKVTPAHDPNDYVLGKKHNLEFINCLYPDARMNEFAGVYKDMDRFKAREAILHDLKEKGFLEKITPHTMSTGHCYRCHTIIEPYLSKQWFVKTKPLAQPAIKAVKEGKIKFHPNRWTKVYLNWMENIQDWCISRQIWWGHRLPVYYCKSCQQSAISRQQKAESGELKVEGKEGVIVSKTKPQNCPNCGSTEIYQDQDVLDTWFSSWLWPFTTFGWPKDSADIKYFYPTSALVTAPEIIFFWVARMIMAGFEFMGKEPFKDVYIHGTVRDIEGKKMSKSLGNIIDPLEIINEYGTDALRFSLISITAQGQDVFLSKERFEQGRNFANKIWNASRFILMNLEPEKLSKIDCFARLWRARDDSSEDVINRWIFSRFNRALKEVDKSLGAFKFNEAANLLYGFFWHEFCDWYLEIIKADIKKPCNQQVMRYILENYLKILHPFMPFISEEIWQMMQVNKKSDDCPISIMRQTWPQAREQAINKKIEREVKSLFEIITNIRNLRGSIEIKPEQKVKISIYCHSKDKLELIQENLNLIINLARLEELIILDKNLRPKDTITAVAKESDIYLQFKGLLDIEQERVKIKGRITALEKSVKAKESRLKNAEFLKNAPNEIIGKEREGMLNLSEELKRLEKMLNELH